MISRAFLPKNPEPGRLRRHLQNSPFTVACPFPAKSSPAGYCTTADFHKLQPHSQETK